MKTPKVSFVIAAHNAEAYLAECLNSLINQSLKSIEIRVIANGCTDATERLIMHYIGADPRVYLHKWSEGDRSAARNIGIFNAKAPIVAILDSDDVADRERAQKTLDFFQKNDPSKFVFHSSAAVITPFGEEVGQIVASPVTLEEALKRGENGIVHSSMAYSREVGLDHQYDSRCGKLGVEDWHQQLRMMKTGLKFEHSPAMLVAWRKHPSNTTNTRKQEEVVVLKKEMLANLGLKTPDVVNA